MCIRDRLTIITQTSQEILSANLKFFVPILIKFCLEDAFSNSERSLSIMKLTCNCLEKCSQQDVICCGIDIDFIMDKFTQCIKEKQPQQKKKRDDQQLINGIMELLRVLMLIFPEKRIIYGQKHNLVYELLENCLFGMKPSKDKKTDSGPKFKTNPSRTCALRLLGALCKETTENLSLIHISEPTRQAEISYAVFCLKKKKRNQYIYSNLASYCILYTSQ
eukprot:TRINITY_DN5684_c0_g1_i2.p1 TRINITY_DN5684_c0_g1~~TRINITY_DN5684_c0_g1_i2.p1  ORF type:complete len:220 (+),score=50.87 TRINITY_DN5684_c0_g1_i2:66-725(+)